MTVASRTGCFAGMWCGVLLALAGCAGTGDAETLGSNSQYLSGPATAADCPSGSNVITGTPGNDVLVGTSKNDCILGLDGDDRIEGGNGNDTLIGGAGSDDLFGGNGSDVLAGGVGDDVLVGGNGDDDLFGGDGNDVIEAGNGNDVVEGGLCHDTIMGDSGDDELLGNAGADRIEDGRGHDSTNGGDGPDACQGANCELAQCGDGQCDDDGDCHGGKRCVVATGICALPSEVAFSDVSCDGSDEDCDGAVDEDFVPVATTCGVGACAAVGQTTCVAGATGSSCMPGTPAADDASCNGIDDDCDGAVDEDFVAMATSCGAGLCAGAGLTSCQGGNVVDSCLPVTGVDDGNPCTSDSCDPMVGPVHVSLPAGTSCSDGDACNGEELCSGVQTAFTAIAPRSTYLRTERDSPLHPVSHDLASLGLMPGDVVTISVVGAMKNSASDLGTSVAMGIFSSNSTVLIATNRMIRVPGALQSDAPQYVTPVTLMGNLATDVPQDFRFDPNGLTVTIPAGATHFIAGALSNFFGDNTNLPGSPFGFVISTAQTVCMAGTPPAVCE
jgi:hypothetical protein